MDWRYMLRGYVKDQNTQRDNNRTQLILHRSTVVDENLIGKTVFVHNGRTLSEIRINSDMVGFRVGEFSTTASWYNSKS